MEKNEMASVRRARLKLVINERFDGSQARLVEAIGGNAGELSGLLRTRHFGEKKARALEMQLGLPQGWMDGVDDAALSGLADDQKAPENIDVTRLALAIEYIEGLLLKLKIELSQISKANLLIYLIEDVREFPPEKDIFRLIELTK